jgi:hypothetical protein
MNDTGLGTNGAAFTGAYAARRLPKMGTKVAVSALLPRGDAPPAGRTGKERRAGITIAGRDRSWDLTIDCIGYVAWALAGRPRLGQAAGRT